ncbi:MAG TPA: nuclear transport factor 2 family protein [Clostridia bacterium]|nr:nuclear transport factor 2 family protein [Clostridia bacterium]
MDTRTSSGLALADRLHDAVNSHDLDSMAGCFATDFVNETPVHPARSFRGREQVRKNWAQIFAAVPDLEAELLGSMTDGEVVWTEWEMRGTRVDNGTHLMRGVAVFKFGNEQFTSVRFYLEPVEQGGSGVDMAVRMALGQ